MSYKYNLIIKNGSCFINGEIKKTDLALKENKISKIGEINFNAEKIYDASGKLVLPGIIDTQVHFREPGLTHKGEIVDERTKNSIKEVN